MKSLELKIEGMHCAGCADTITALVSRELGVKSVTVSHAAGRGRVLYDPAQTDPARIAHAIEGAGYRVRSDPGRSA